MAKLNELELKNEIADTPDFGDLPEQIGGQFPDPPQPGAYRVRFPQPAAIQDAWDVFETQRGQRLALNLRGEAALYIVQSPGGRYNGESMETRISNAERKRGQDDSKLASDMDYLLVATKYPGKRPRFGANQEAAQALLSCAGKEFGIDWEYSWYCNDKKPIRVEDAANSVQVLDGEEGRQLVKGCGSRFYMRDVPKEPNPQTNAMEYPVRITCTCGAQLRAFGQIARFRE